MSLVVLSNSQSAYDQEDGTTSVLGVQNPNSFHNAMSNTITLPPHTEVGVVSAKLFRRPKVVIQSNSVFYAYFGKLLTQAQVLEVVSTNIPVEVIVPAGTYSQDEFQGVLQTALSDAFGSHPNLAEFGVVVTKPESAGLPTAVEGGWSYTLLQTSVASEDADRAKIVSDISGKDLTFRYLGASIVDDSESLKYTKADKHIKRVKVGASATKGWDDGGQGMINNLPINMSSALTPAQGSFSVNFDNAIDNGLFSDSEGWMIGLSRPECRSGQSPPAVSVAPYFSGEAGPMFDYCVWYSGEDELLHVGHVIDFADDEYKFQEITYWGTDIQGHDARASATQLNRTDLSYGGGVGTRLNWIVQGEQMKLTITDDLFANDVTIMNTTVDDWAKLGLKRAFKPTGTTTQTLYPKFDLSTKDKYLVLNNYEAPLQWAKRSGEVGGYDYPGDVPLVGVSEPSGGSSFWGKCIYNTRTMQDASLSDLCQRCEGLETQIAYVGQDSSLLSAGAKIDSEAIKYGYGLILNQSFGGAGGYTNSGTGNCRSWLGFPADKLPGNVLSLGGFNHQGTISDAGGGDANTGDSTCKYVVNSFSALGFSPKQLFIRCPTLTHQSFNFCKGLTSKILWSLPRFSNDGATTGPLFFQQAQPIYLALRNNAPLVINDLQIDFVSKDEIIAEDLGGETVVILHFRTSHHS